MRSKSSLFLIEQLIVIAVFAICATVCVRIFVESHILSNAGADINNALFITKNSVESFKAASGDIDITAHILGINLYRHSQADNVFFAYYDKEWAPCGQDDARYVLYFEPYYGTGDEGSLVFCRLRVERLGDGALSGTILELTAAARKD